MIIPVYFKTFQSNFPYHFSNYRQIVLLSTEKTLHCTEGWEGKATSNKANKKNAAEAIFLLTGANSLQAEEATKPAIQCFNSLRAEPIRNINKLVFHCSESFYHTANIFNPH